MFTVPVVAESVPAALRHPRLRGIFDSKVAPAVVFPVSHPVGLSVIRTLQDHAIPILALDSKPGSAGLYSRHVRSLLMAGMTTSPESFAETMLALGRGFRERPVLFLVDDDELFLSLKMSERFAQVYRMPLSGWDVVEPIVDKGKLYRRLQALGYPVPRSWFASSPEEIDRLSAQIAFPCIIKPTYSTDFRRRFGVKAKRFDEPGPLRSFARGLLEIALDFVVQEFIEGPASQLYTYAAYSDDDGRVIASFTGRKLRQFPPDFGTCRLSESVCNPDLEQAGAELLRILRYRGISLTEFKLAPDGRFKLIELNPRPGDWPERLAQLCGANLVLTAYRAALGENVEPHRISRFGVKWAHVSEDLYYCLRGFRLFGYPQESLSLFQWLRSMRGVESAAFFSWDDPVPALVRFPALVREFAARERSRKRSGP